MTWFTSNQATAKKEFFNSPKNWAVLAQAICRKQFHLQILSNNLIFQHTSYCQKQVQFMAEFTIFFYSALWQKGRKQQYEGSLLKVQVKDHTGDQKLKTLYHQDMKYVQTLHQEPSVTQRSNQDMVDRGVYDWVPDIPETQELKHGNTRTYSISKMFFKNHLSLKDPTRRWWIGVSLMRFLTYKREGTT